MAVTLALQTPSFTGSSSHRAALLPCPFTHSHARASRGHIACLQAYRCPTLVFADGFQMFKKPQGFVQKEAFVSGEEEVRRTPAS